MLTALRYITLLPLMAVIWLGSIAVIFFLLSLIEAFCPQDMTAANMCFASWYGHIETTLLTLSYGIAAVCTALFCWHYTPGSKKHKKIAFMLCIALQILLVLGFAWSANTWLESGLSVSLLILCFFYKQRVFA